MKTSRIAALAIAPLALFSLGGCAGGLGPGVAAEVGNTTISRSDVDLLSGVLCKDVATAVAQQSGASTAAFSAVRASAANFLIESERTARFAAKLGAPYDKEELRNRMKSIGPLLKGLSKDDAAAVRRMVADINTGDLQLQAIGAQVLDQQGVQNPDGQAQFNAGYDLRHKEFDDSVKVEVASDLAPNKDGVAGQGDRSLSKPVSSFAKQSVSSQPPPNWATGLPASQKCG